MSTLNLKEANTTIISDGSAVICSLRQDLTCDDDASETDHTALHRANRTASSGVLESLMSAKSLRNRLISASAELKSTADICGRHRCFISPVM
jgi:hypothetical protein